MRKEINLIKFAGKCVLLFLLATFCYSGVALTWETYTEDALWEGDETRKIRWCNEYLAKKKYGDLWEYLELYDLHHKRYDKYWDAVEARAVEIQEIQESKAGK